MFGHSGERRRVGSGSPFEATIGFSRAIRVGPQIWVSGTAPVEADGSCRPDAYGQAQRCLEIITAALAELDGTPADVVRTRIYVTDLAVAADVARAHAEVFGDVRPAATQIVVSALLDPRWLVEIEADAFVARP
jgi:enamine deaminase RidA (YjgF/YER057c/UK114 family)